MIPDSGACVQVSDWQRLLAEGFSRVDELLAYLQLNKDQLPVAEQIQTSFGLKVPRAFAARMGKGDPNDPLLLQVLPRLQETQPVVAFSHDPVGDKQAEKSPGLLQKYQGRALIIATGACAIHCRYCFRRHYAYAQGSASPQQWQGIIDYLTTHDEVNEIILSGGDPLMLTDEKLSAWFGELGTIPHLKRLRLHTRLPVVLPQRITPALVQLLSGSRLQTLMVLHANHANELSPSVTQALQPLRRHGVNLLNQSVLLRGINDDVDALAELSERLFSSGILPYYLHLLDRVDGAAHFEVEDRHARELYGQLLARLPGYLVPKLVREIAGHASKTPIFSN